MSETSDFGYPVQSGPRIITDVMKPDRAAAVVQAAVELAEILGTNAFIYDLTVQAQGALFADKLRQAEERHGSLIRVNGVPRAPRTNEEIMAKVVAPGARDGYMGVVIEVPSNLLALDSMWHRAEEIVQQHP